MKVRSVRVVNCQAAECRATWLRQERNYTSGHRFQNKTRHEEHFSQQTQQHQTDFKYIVLYTMCKVLDYKVILSYSENINLQVAALHSKSTHY